MQGDTILAGVTEEVSEGGFPGIPGIPGTPTAIAMRSVSPESPEQNPAHTYKAGDEDRDPTASASGTPTSGNGPLPVQFTGEGDDKNTTTYTATLTVTDEDGETDSDSVSIDVHDEGSVTCSWDFGHAGAGSSEWVPPPYTYPVGEGSPPTASASADPTMGAAPLTVQFTGEGEDKNTKPYTAVLTVTDESQKTATDSVSISVDDPGEITKYSWAFGDGETGTGKVVPHEYKKGGVPGVIASGTPTTCYAPLTVQFIGSGTPQYKTYVATLTTEDEDGQTGTSSVSVKVHSGDLTYSWDFGDGSPKSNQKKPPPHTYTSPGIYTAAFTVTGAGYVKKTETVTVVAKVVEIEMELEKVGKTVIELENNCSENTTIRVTAVNAADGSTVTWFTGTVGIAEDTSDPEYIEIYSQNGGDLPDSVTITSGGTTTFVAKSLAGPKVEKEKPPDPALIVTTNFPVRGGAPLQVPQWTNDLGKVHNLSMDDVCDWFETRTKHMFETAQGDLVTVLSKVALYKQVETGSPGQTPKFRSSTGSVYFNPNYLAVRLDTKSPPMAGEAIERTHRCAVFHEARHCYQNYLCNSDELGVDDDTADPDRKNDEDSDWLVDEVPIAPKYIFVDTTDARSVWKTGNNVHDVSYSGDLKADPYETANNKGAMNAREKDACKFANRHDN